MANVPETQTRLAQIERKVELMEERLKKLELDKWPEPCKCIGCRPDLYVG